MSGEGCGICPGGAPRTLIHCRLPWLWRLVCPARRAVRRQDMPRRHRQDTGQHQSECAGSHGRPGERGVPETREDPVGEAHDEEACQAEDNPVATAISRHDAAATK